MKLIFNEKPIDLNSVSRLVHLYGTTHVILRGNWFGNDFEVRNFSFVNR